MEKPILLVMIDKYLEESGLKNKPGFTTKFLVRKIREEAAEASKCLEANNKEALKDRLVNLIFLMTSASSIMGINPADEINRRIEQFRKGNHPLLDELMQSR